MEQPSNLKAFILGASGAIGRELINELIRSKAWSEIAIVVRRKLEEWDQFNEEEKSKLNIILKDDLDSLEDPSQWNLSGYNTVFCCLGTQVKVGKELFIKVDYTYPIYGGKLAAHFKIPHYSLVSTTGADSKSWFLYTKTKGQTEQALKDLKLPQLSIMQPGLFLNRRNDSRLGEKIAAIMPCVPKIEAQDLAKALRIEAELQAKTPNQNTAITYSNSDLHHMVKTGTYPEQKKK